MEIIFTSFWKFWFSNFFGNYFPIFLEIPIFPSFEKFWAYTILLAHKKYRLVCTYTVGRERGKGEKMKMALRGIEERERKEERHHCGITLASSHTAVLSPSPPTRKLEGNKGMLWSPPSYVSLFSAPNIKTSNPPEFHLLPEVCHHVVAKLLQLGHLLLASTRFIYKEGF